jgi:hypothetical protein
MESILVFVNALISLIMVITFFVMAHRLSILTTIIKNWSEVEFQKKEYKDHYICPSCKADVWHSKFAKDQDFVSCNCGKMIKISEYEPIE